MKLSIRPALAAASLSLMCASAAGASVPLHFSFSPGSYYDYISPPTNGPVTGSFDFDPASGDVSNVDYTSISGHFTTGGEYPGDNSGTQVYFGDFNGVYDVYQLASSLVNGGTIDILSGTHAGIDIAAGGSVSTNVTGAVPEPATWAMMLMGFGIIGVGLRMRLEPSASMGPA